MPLRLSSFAFLASVRHVWCRSGPTPQACSMTRPKRTGRIPAWVEPLHKADVTLVGSGASCVEKG